MKDFGQFYFPENCSYNIHMLLHMCEYAKTLEPFDSFSAYKFENNMSEIKKMIKKPTHILQQISNRLAEDEHIMGDNEIEKEFFGPLRINMKGIIETFIKKNMHN